MKLLALLLFAASAFAQTPTFLPCYFTTPPTSQPTYLQVTATSPFVQCEQIALDASVTNPPIRSAAGKLTISALGGVPVHNYTTTLQWPFAPSNATYNDAAGTGPSPFAGQPVWCASTSTAGLQTFAGQLGSYLPAMIIEFRQAGSATPVLTTGGTLSAENPNNGGRYLWIQSAAQCGGNPGLVFTAAANSIVVGAATTASSLISLVVVGLI